MITAQTNAIKKDFPLLEQSPRLVYLDNAATTQKPDCVLRRMGTYYRQENANVHRGQYPLSVRSESAYAKARATVQRWLGASRAEQIVFTKNSTEALNLVARGLEGQGLGPEDNVVVTELEHSAAFYPFREVCRRTGAAFRVIPARKDGTLDPEEASRYLDRRTRLLCVTAMSNVTGYRPPVQELIRQAHRWGARVMVDATQEAAHHRIRVEELDCDFLCFSAHKVYGPMGCGVLYGKQEALAQLPPLLYGGGMLEPEGPGMVRRKAPPEGLEGGTPDVAAAVGLAAALDYLQARDFPAMMAREAQLAGRLREQLDEVPGLRVTGPEGPSPIVSFTLAGYSPYDLGVLLGQAGIAVRCGAHCAYPLLARLGLESSCRVSLGIYNTPEDIDALVQCLKNPGRAVVQ